MRKHEKAVGRCCCLQTCNLMELLMVISNTDILIYAKYIIMYYKSSFVVVYT